MTQALRRLAEGVHPGFPVTVYYAFKQSERKGGAGVASTGWETFLDAVIRSGFAITGTWPMRTELGNRMVGMRSNALASSIVLVCRRHAADAPTATRRELLTALRSELPRALRLLQTGNIVPVDLAQAAIGPGMAIYTRYAWFSRKRRVCRTACSLTSAVMRRLRRAAEVQSNTCRSVIPASKASRVESELCNLSHVPVTFIPRPHRAATAVPPARRPRWSGRSPRCRRPVGSAPHRNRRGTSAPAADRPGRLAVPFRPSAPSCA